MNKFAQTVTNIRGTLKYYFTFALRRGGADFSIDALARFLLVQPNDQKQLQANHNHWANSADNFQIHSQFPVLIFFIFSHAFLSFVSMSILYQL